MTVPGCAGRSEAALFSRALRGRKCLERERELRKEGREVPSRVRLREGPIGLRITLGQPSQHLSLLLLPLLQFTAPPPAASTPIPVNSTFSAASIPPAVHSTSLYCFYHSCSSQHLPLLLLPFLQSTTPLPTASTPQAVHSSSPCCFYPSCSSQHLPLLLVSFLHSTT